LPPNVIVGLLYPLALMPWLWSRDRKWLWVIACIAVLSLVIAGFFGSGPAPVGLEWAHWVNRSLSAIVVLLVAATLDWQIRALDARDRAEAAARQGEMRIAGLAGSVPSIMWEAAPDGRNTWVSESWNTYFGQSTEEVAGDGWSAVVHPDDLASTTPAWEAAIRSGGTFEHRQRMRRKDGTWRWHLVRGNPLTDADGRVFRWVGSVTEVHDLVEAREQLRVALDAGQIGVWEWDADEGRSRRTGAVYARWGIESESRAAMPAGFAASVHPEDRTRLFEAVDAALRGTAPYEMEFRIVDPAGKVHWLAGKGEVIRDDAGRPLRMIGVNYDITARKGNEQRLRLMLGELNHRVKNMLATVQSLAVQSFRNVEGSKGAVDDFQGRLMALAKTHDVLAQESWAGAPLADLVENATRLYRSSGPARFDIVGPEVWLSPRMALAMSMCLHELCTNAVKYGALSNDTGRVAVNWAVGVDKDGMQLRLDWKEEGGPPVVTPSRRGFGLKLIERGLAHELRGKAAVSFEPVGLRCTVVARLDPPVAEIAGEDDDVVVRHVV
jgi:PAS domain S-box-containing protein